MRGGGCLAAGGLLLLLYVLAGVLIQVGRSGGRVDVDGAGRHGRGAWRVRARAPAVPVWGIREPCGGSPAY